MPVSSAQQFAVAVYASDRPLSAEDGQRLQRGLEKAMPDLRIPELFASRPALLTEVEHLVVGAGADGQPLSVLGASWKKAEQGQAFLHIAVQFVARSARGTTAFSESWLALLTRLLASSQFPRLSVLKTYNPVAYCAMRTYGALPGASMFPDVTVREQDPELVALGRRLASALDSSAPYDAEIGRLRGIGQPTDLYRSRPTCHDPAVNDYFLRNSSPGDRILCFVDLRNPELEEQILGRFDERARQRQVEPR
jgi:hypothetical protein